MDTDLLDDALATALAVPEIAHAISRLAEDDEADKRLREALVGDVRSRASDIESAARDELARLAAAQVQLDAALEDPIDATIARTTGAGEEHRALSRLLAVDFSARPSRATRLVSRLAARTRRRASDAGSPANLLSIEAWQIAAEKLSAEELAERLGEFQKEVEAEIDRIRGRARDVVLAMPDYPEVAEAAAALTAARAAARRAVLQRGVLPLCRDWVNLRLREREEERLSRTLVATEAPGLAELPNPDHEVPTPDGEQLGRLLSQLPGGSVGLSGPRGSGKTTLLRSFQQGRRWIGKRPPGLTAMVAAPVEYAPRDFVLHLFERLCLAAQNVDGVVVEPQEGPESRRPAGLALGVAGAGLAAAAVGAVLVVQEAQASDVSGGEQLTILASLLVATAVLGWPILRPPGDEVRFRLPVAGAVLAAGLVVALVEQAPGVVTVIAVIGVGGQLLLALARSRIMILDVAELREMPYRPWWGTAGFVPYFAVGEAAALALLSAAGVDLGDNVVTGAAVVLLGGLTAVGVTALARAAKPSVQRRIRLPAFASIACAVIGQSIGLLLMILDVSASDRLLLGSGLVVAGVWVIALAQRWATRYQSASRSEPAGAPAPDSSTDDPLDPVRLGELEDVFASLAVDLPEWNAERVADGQSALRTWRASGGPLPFFAVRDALSVSYSLSPDSAEFAAFADASNALDRAEQRRDAWQRAGETWLRRIRYQQTFSTTWSGKVGLSKPVSLEASRGGGRSSAELPMTLPQIVSGLQDFLRLAGAVEPVVIAIDELDKMGSAEGAERFLNEIKAVFGVANCYFLISVSEDAVASFERRGLPFRDVVDSSFDEVLRVAYLSLADSEALLAKRVVSLPLPFAALCHAVSGGLARDLIRTTRALFDLRRVKDKAELPDLCRELVVAELRAKRDGTVTAIRSLGSSIDVSAPLCWVAAVDPADPSAKALRRTSPPLLTPPAQFEHEAQRSAALSLDRHIRELLGFWYLCATLVDVFGQKLTFDQMKELTSSDGGPRDLGTFARARQSFAVDADLAWRRVSTIRQAWSFKAVGPRPLYAVSETVAGSSGQESLPAPASHTGP